MKLFPNFTSIPFDYLLISWVTNYTHNRGVLTCLSHRELLEHWNGLTAKVHIFLSEIMKKSCDKFLPRLDDFLFFVTDSKIHQTLNFYLKSTKANRLAKVIRVLSGKFTESSTMLLHRARLRRLHKCIQNTHKKLVLTTVNFGSKFVFRTDLYFIWRRAQIHRITSLSSRSITRSATGSPFKNFRCHTITNNLFFLTRSWFLRSSVN